MNQEGLDKVIDTVISMKSFADSAKDITPEQKALFSAGKMRLQMNIKEKIFKIDTDIPFKSYGDLQLLLAGGGKASPQLFHGPAYFGISTTTSPRTTAWQPSRE